LCNNKGNDPARRYKNSKNIYALKSSVPNLIKQTCLSLKEQIDPDAIIVVNLNTALSQIDRTYRQKINKYILEVNNTIDEMDLRHL
jgi:hypothetical protein